MGLFDKKFCDVCGEKIGLLGNRKLEDGNLCKDCAAKLSPFFSGRKNSTVDEIKQQLAYREENKQKLMNFRPTRTIGERKKVYIDEAAGTFIVTSSTNWRDANPDIIALSQVTACNTDIKENRDEIYRETEDGKRESYNPPRYEYSYDFLVDILVNSPWFSEIHIELSNGNRPDSRYTELYHEYERQMYELSNALTGRGAAPQGYGQPNQGYAQPNQGYAQPNQGYAQPNQGYAQPNQGYAQPNQGYAQPNQGYAQPNQGYAQPNQSYAQPNQGYAQPNQGYAQPAAAFGAAAAANNAASAWNCPSCGAQSSGAFCQNCGTKKPMAQQTVRCDKCGWMPNPGEQIPRFCPQCGDPINANDMQ
ncbi:MAG: DUF4428 domain-containing protein [Acutalibacteraceae bacterium]